MGLWERVMDLIHFKQEAVTGQGVANSAVNKLDLGAGYKPASDQYWTATRAGYLDEFGPANVPGDIDTLLSRSAGGENEDTATGLDLNAGTASSGETGEDIFTISTTTRKKLHALAVSMANVTSGATITVRAYTKTLNADAALTNFYKESFVKGTDPDLIFIVDGTMGIRNDVRVEMRSNNANDTSVDVSYQYVLEDME